MGDDGKVVDAIVDGMMAELGGDGREGVEAPSFFGHGKERVPVEDSEVWGEVKGAWAGARGKGLVKAPRGARRGGVRSTVERWGKLVWRVVWGQEEAGEGGEVVVREEAGVYVADGPWFEVWREAGEMRCGEGWVVRRVELFCWELADWLEVSGEERERGEEVVYVRGVAGLNGEPMRGETVVATRWDQGDWSEVVMKTRKEWWQ